MPSLQVTLFAALTVLCGINNVCGIYRYYPYGGYVPIQPPPPPPPPPVQTTARPPPITTLPPTSPTTAVIPDTTTIPTTTPPPKVSPPYQQHNYYIPGSQTSSVAASSAVVGGGGVPPYYYWQQNIYGLDGSTGTKTYSSNGIQSGISVQSVQTITPDGKKKQWSKVYVHRPHPPREPTTTTSAPPTELSTLPPSTDAPVTDDIISYLSQPSVFGGYESVSSSGSGAAAAASSASASGIAVPEGYVASYSLPYPYPRQGPYRYPYYMPPRAPPGYIPVV